MMISRWVALLALACCAGCASTGAKAVAVPPAGGDMGYVLERGGVRFVFEPGIYDYATNGRTGDWQLVREITIETVHVAGEFNGWSTSAWSMGPEQGAARYALTKPSADLGTGKTVQFKFVVNGEWWVEPPPRAPNRVTTGFENRSANFVLTLP